MSAKHLDGHCQSMRLFLVWDSETISETSDMIVESLFEAIDGDSDVEKAKSRGSKRKHSAKKSSSSSSESSESYSKSEAGLSKDMGRQAICINHCLYQIEFLFV